MPLRVTPDAADLGLHHMRNLLDTPELQPLYDTEI